MLKKSWNQFIVAALLGLLLVLSSCDGGPKIAPLGPEAVVLAFGDSLTYGTGAGLDASYPAVLEGLLRRKVVNAGVPGEVSAEGLRRLPALLERHRPALLVLCHGGNDFLQRRDPAQLAANLREMIALARRQGADVVLLGVPQLGLILSPAGLYAELAKEFALPYDGELLCDLLGDRALKSDPIHPNAAGYRQMAQTVAALIEKAQGKKIPSGFVPQPDLRNCAQTFARLFSK